MSPLLQKASPAFFQLPTLPPFSIPPEDFDLWTEQNEREFVFWQGENGKQNTKDDYMDFLHTINKEYNMDDVFNKLEEGLEAFEKLESCMNLFPNYDLKKDLDESYVDKENAIMKKFIKIGIKFVRNNGEKVKNFIACMESNENEECEIIDKCGPSQEDEQTIGLSQSNDAAESSKTFAEETENGDEKSENGDVKIESGDVEVKREKKAKKKKSKEKKVLRLLKYHLKLVEERGLPPSRLMQQQQLQTPRLSSSETIRKRNLFSEFEKLGGSKEGAQQVGSPADPSETAAVGHGGVEAVLVQPNVNENRISSGFYSPSLYSGSQSIGASGNAGGSDARPQWVTGWNYPQHFQQGSTGVSSGYMQQSSLCSSPVTCLVWNPPITPVCQAQPTPYLPPSGGPAYCSSCMLFGNVFTVSPV